MLRTSERLLLRCCWAERNVERRLASCASRSLGDSPTRWNAKAATTRFAASRRPSAARTSTCGSRKLRLELLIIRHREMESVERVRLSGRRLGRLGYIAEEARELHHRDK